MNNQLYDYFSDRVFIKYKNGKIVKRIDVTIEELRDEIEKFKNIMDDIEFQKTLNKCLYEIATNLYSDEVVDVILNYIKYNEKQLDIRRNHPLIHEMSHQVSLVNGGSIDNFKKIVTHPVYNCLVNDPHYIDTYGFTVKERLALEMHNFQYSRKENIKDFISWINNNLNVKAVKETHHKNGNFKCPTVKEYTFRLI